MKTITHIKLAAAREERLQQIGTLFSKAAGPDLGAEMQGGRAAALARLAAVDAQAYAKTRNHLSGAVTHLSPYIRHGCLSLQEVISDILMRFGPASAKLVSELAYHAYFRQVWHHYGEAILHEMEAPKVPLGQRPLPAYVTQGITGLVCMDEVVRDLVRDGYVHNHARMWFAAYLVHWLKVDWREAADWFEALLLDGNLASNHLSWQWVASSFSHKPYFFNRESMQQFGGERYCQQCKVRCPFDADYASLEHTLFTRDAAPTPIMIEPSRKASELTAPPAQRISSAGSQSMIWVHDEMLSPTHPLQIDGRPGVFVFDPQLYAHWPRKRLQFMADCLAEMTNVETWTGNTAEVFNQLGASSIVTQDTPQPLLKQALAGWPVAWQAEPALTTSILEPHDLMRFSRYWKKAGPDIMQQAEHG